MRKMLMCVAILLSANIITPVVAKPLVANEDVEWTEALFLLTDVHFAEDVTNVEWALYPQGKYVAIQVIPLNEQNEAVVTDGRDPNVISESFWLEDIPYHGSIVQLQAAIERLWLRTLHHKLPITFTVHP